MSMEVYFEVAADRQEVIRYLTAIKVHRSHRS